ncbi:MAG: hypothetical protein WAX25_00485 [Minisyncoccia bacterium]
MDTFLLGFGLLLMVLSIMLLIYLSFTGPYDRWLVWYLNVVFFVGLAFASYGAFGLDVPRSGVPSGALGLFVYTKII